MRLGRLEYHAPATIDEACALLLTLRPRVRAIAGGTDVLADLKLGRLAGGHLVSLARIPGLDRIVVDRGGLSIGALATPNRIATSPEVRAVLPALADAAAVMGGNQIRNLATIGGNLAGAVPSADLPPALLAAHAMLRLVRRDGERFVSAGDFFLGPRRTALLPGEVLESVHVRAPPAGTGSAYLKFQLRDASALAVVGVAARLEVVEGRVASAAVAVGAAAPTPILVPAAERLVGRAPGEEAFREAGAVVEAAVAPIDDLRGSAGFRRRIAAVLTARALALAAARAK